MSDRKGVDPLFPPIERTSWDFIDWSGSPTLKQARQEAEKAAAEITRLRAALAEAERERDRLRSYDGGDTPFEAAQIRDGVLRAAEEKAAHQVLAIAAQRAAGRDPLGMKAKDAEIARLRAEHDAALKGELLLRQDVLDDNDRLRHEKAKLVKALEPFAAILEKTTGDAPGTGKYTLVTVASLHRARAALRSATETKDGQS